MKSKQTRVILNTVSYHRIIIIIIIIIIIMMMMMMMIITIPRETDKLQENSA